ncbi:MAG TPA: hypothetical protein VHI13_13200 [Candidatus Kapabacteria bacterium]|nr:hypothetical protein [Candidatus Kapabacteria bacterium]
MSETIPSVLSTHSGQPGSLRRTLVALLLAAVLAAAVVDGRESWREPAPIVMTMTVDPPRFGRPRPYRAHYRRGHK